MNLNQKLLLLFFLFFVFVNISFARISTYSNNKGVNSTTFSLLLKAQKVLDKSNSLRYADLMYSNSSLSFDKEGELLSYVIKSEHYILKQNPDSVRYFALKMKEMTGKSSNYKFYYFRIRYWAAYLLICNHRYASALKEIRDYQLEAIDWKSDIGIGLGYKLMGDLFLMQNKKHSAFLLYEKGYEYLSSHDNIPDKVVLAGAIGKYYYEIGRYNEAIFWLKRGVTCEYEENILAESYIYIVMSYLNLGEYLKVDMYVNKIEHLKSIHTFFPFVSDVYNCMYALKSYASDKNSNKSVEYLKKSNLLF